MYSAYRAATRNLFTTGLQLLNTSNPFPSRFSGKSYCKWVLLHPNYWIITMISLWRWCTAPSNVVPSIAAASQCLYGQITVGFTVCCGSVSSALPASSYMQQWLLMRIAEQCITTELRWGSGFVMGCSDTMLSRKLMMTTGSNLGHSRRTIMYCLPSDK